MSKQKNTPQKNEKAPWKAVNSPQDGHGEQNGRDGQDGAGATASLVPIVPPVKVRSQSPANDASKTTRPFAVQGESIATNGGAAARAGMVRPVKARVSNGHTPALGGQANGNGHDGGLGAQIELVRAQPSTTAHLREADITHLRLRLKASEWEMLPPYGRPRRGSSARRPLPYFLMRHRNLRSTSRVGHVRALLAAHRHGSGGASGALLKVFVALFLVLTLTSGAVAGAGVGGASFYISQLPPVDPSHLAAAISTNGINTQTTKIYDRNGTLLFDLVDEGTGRREELDLNEISPLVISATVAAEDSTFFTNPGVDPVAVLRAVNINLSGDGSSGASTITQQVARQVLLSPDERNAITFSRKIKEAVLAVELTRTYSKNEIMKIFLNQNYYGHRAYGIGAAALTYFGKSAKDLTLPEAALLAGLPQAPTQYDPLVNPDQAKKRQAIVLNLMAKQRMITQQQADAAKAETLVLHPYQPQIQAPHFVYYVKQYLESKYGPDVDTAGLKVYTTLDLRVQQAAEQVAKDRISELQKQDASNAAIVVMKPNTGEILAMVGSVDYYNTAIDGQVNVAIRERQPGSSFKPFTYVTAFEKGWTPGTVLLDTLTAFPNGNQKPYEPRNYDGRDHGWVTARQALANSYNVPAVKTLQFAGIQNVIDTAHAMGIKGLNRGLDWYGLSLTLGGGEVTLLDMTNAYSTFANGGVEVDANPILSIEDPQGRTIYQLDPNIKQNSNNQVIDPRYAYMITSILSDNKARSAAFGVNNPLRLDFPAAAKTGTTDDNRDSWTLGYTPNLTVGVWVGNSNNAPMLKVTGAIGAAVIWNNVMNTFYSRPEFQDLVRGADGKVQTDFVQPPGLITATACSAKGPVTDLFLADAPPKGCTTYRDKNPQVRSGGSSNDGGSNNRPAARPTPIPGIIYPTPEP